MFPLGTVPTDLVPHPPSDSDLGAVGMGSLQTAGWHGSALSFSSLGDLSGIPYYRLVHMSQGRT